MLTYTLTELPPPAGAGVHSSTDAEDVNSDGLATGYVFDTAHPEEAFEAAIWPEVATPEILEGPPPETLGWAINDAGDAVGLFGLTYPVHSFLYHHDTGQVADLGPDLGGPENRVADINNDGVITGSAGGIDTQRPLIYDSKNGSLTMLDPLPGHAMAGGAAINELGHVVGGSANANWEDHRAFIYRDGNMEDLGPAVDVWDVNNTDVIAGTGVVPGPPWPVPWSAFRLDASVPNPSPQMLGHSQVPGYTSSLGFAINDDSVVVGWSGDAQENSRAFVDIPSGDDAGFHDLQDVVVEADGWVLEQATGISNTGYIVGTGTYQGEKRAYLLTPAPNYWLKKEFEKVREALLGLLMIFGGATKGGPGFGLLPGGKPIPIDPHSPARERWEKMTEAERDLFLGFAIQHLNSIVSGRERGEIVQRAGRQIVDSAIAELEGKSR
jgi:probable HAF family extracellular repeat protein